MNKGILLAGLLAMAVAGPALSQEHPEHPKKGAATGGIEAVVVGQNFCVGCSLKSEGAAAQCDKYGHNHALRVTSATVAGKEVPEMKGWVLHYLDTDGAQAYLKEHHEEMVTVAGKIYRDARVFEVGKSVAGKKPEHPEHPKK